MCKNLTFAAIAMMALSMTASCSSDNDSSVIEQVNNQPTSGKAHVRLKCGTAMDVSISKAPATRAALAANGVPLTDLYILDYDKTSGKLLQVLRQTSMAQDFAEPDLTLNYGEHTLKVVATRSTSPTLLDALAQTWNPTANVLTPVSASVPVVMTSDKTSDTFGAMKDVSVGIGKATTVSISLERLVAKLEVVCTDEFPAECSTIDMYLDEYRDLSLTTLDVTNVVGNHRIADVSVLAGTTGTTLNYYLFAPANGYTADITFTMNRKTCAPYASFTVSDVPLKRNGITSITGSFYNHLQGLSVSVNDAWNEDKTDIGI